jgi:hypothetical protein
MATWVCGECGVVYSVGAPRCPACGADIPSEEGAFPMAKISKADGPSYAGVIPDEMPSDEDYTDAQERVAKGDPEQGDGALISRYESARARRLSDPHAEPAQIAERSSGDASLKATEGGDASLEYSDAETGQPRLTEQGEAFLSGVRSALSDDTGEQDGDQLHGEQAEADRREQRQQLSVPEQNGPASKPSPRGRGSK